MKLYKVPSNEKELKSLQGGFHKSKTVGNFRISKAPRIKQKQIDNEQFTNKLLCDNDEEEVQNTEKKHDKREIAEINKWEGDKLENRSKLELTASRGFQEEEADVGT